MDACVAEGVVDHTPLPGQVSGPLGLKQAARTLRAAFPDARATVHDVAEAGDLAVARVTFDATHTGYLMGLAPTGRRVRVSGAFVARVRGGRITEWWSYGDVLGLLRSLGAVSYAPSFTPAALPEPDLG